MEFSQIPPACQGISCSFPTYVSSNPLIFHTLCLPMTQDTAAQDTALMISQVGMDSFQENHSLSYLISLIVHQDIHQYCVEMRYRKRSPFLQ